MLEATDLARRIKRHWLCASFVAAGLITVGRPQVSTPPDKSSDGQVGEAPIVGSDLFDEHRSMLQVAVTATQTVCKREPRSRTAAGRNSTPTFYRDVLPILEEHCQNCHHPGAIAPMPFVTYDQTRPWAYAIREEVLAKKMPPW